MALSFKGAHFPSEVILMGVRWYLAYPLSTRHVEELMEERGVEVDHSTINRWVIKYSPQLEEAFHRRKRPVWVSWRMDETYIKVKGQWRYLYRAVDKQGQTIDFLLTKHRDKEAALRFLKKPDSIGFRGWWKICVSNRMIPPLALYCVWSKQHRMGSQRHGTIPRKEYLCAVR